MKNIIKTSVALFVFMGLPLLGLLVLSTIIMLAMVDLGYLR